MKKKVAVFANGWSNEYLQWVLEGIKKRAKESNIDLHVFINYSSGDENNLENVGERNIFMLPDIEEYDGVMLLANTINLSCEREYLNLEVLKHNLPAVSLEYELPGIPCLCTDTYSGVYDLTMHLIEEHGVRDVIYVSGPEDNNENLLRMKAVQDALAKAEITFEPQRNVRGDWSYYEAYNALCERLKENEKLPDAFICANDEMALGVCTALDHFGIKVPEQVVVTGCDCIDKGQELYPILTTVAREWDKLGYEGLDIVLRQMAGESVPEKQVYNSVIVLGESCGCKVAEERKERRRKSIIRNYKLQRESSINEWHLRHIDDMLAKMKNARELKDHLGWNFSYNHTFEGANFMICLMDKFFSEEEVIRKDSYSGYTELMEVCVHIENGRTKSGGMFYVRDLVPEVVLDETQSHLYLFLPLHVQDKNIGYVVFIDELHNVYNQTLYTWARHISQDLERVRQNILLEELNKKLTEVSMTDALTGLKNRTGYDALAFPYLQKCQREGKLGSMIFADINRMKLINDKYGHLQGDIAICTVADAIKMTLPEGWIAVRFGGDEFIMVGECKNKEEAESIKKTTLRKFGKNQAGKGFVFPVDCQFWSGCYGSGIKL